MSSAEVLGAVLEGICGHVTPIRVIKGGQEFEVGGPEAWGRAARVRVNRALRSVGAVAPHVKLEPDTQVHAWGSSLDLAIAVAAASCRGLVLGDIRRTAFVGELSMDGKILPTPGTLSMAVAVADAGCERLYVATGVAAGVAGVGVEAALESRLTVIPVSSFGDLLEAINGAPTVLAHPAESPTVPAFAPSFLGDPVALRAVEVAAVGGHGILLIGPHGVGKTVLGRILRDLLPPPFPDEALEITMIHSACGLLLDRPGLVAHRPFRAPHHTCSTAALVGGGTPLRPGEVTLAHNGVLLLDEVTEFTSASLEAVAAALADGEVVHSRHDRRVVFPSSAQLVATATACPCGRLGSVDLGKTCMCSRDSIARHQARIDRLREFLPITAHVRASTHSNTEYSISAGRDRVASARAIRAERIGSDGWYVSTADPDWVGDERAHRIARTIADLEGSATVTERHHAEAISILNGPHR
jgi:magnesium chelatase family protein